MKKIVLKCPKCRKKMKISDKAAKYKCPHCSNIYKYTAIKRGTNKFIGFFVGIGTTIRDAKNNAKYKYTSAKNTYKYMKTVKQNMKKNPNWSNYEKEQREMKEMNENLKEKKGFFNKFKKKK